MVIEFAGLPGTGKTTVCDAFIAQLRSNGAEVYEMNYEIRTAQAGRPRAIVRARLATKFVFRHPVLALRIVRAMVVAGGQPVVASRGVLLNILAKCHSLDASRRGHLAVSDEGVVHAIWSLAFEATYPAVAIKDACSVLKYLAPPRMTIVVLESPVADIERRLRLDPKRNRLGRLVVKAGSTAVERARDVMVRLLDELDRIDVASIRVVRIENNDSTPAEAAAATIMAASGSAQTYGAFDHE